MCLHISGYTQYKLCFNDFSKFVKILNVTLKLVYTKEDDLF